jgi:hypothetical protein
MVTIVVSDDQAKLIAEAQSEVFIRDSQGRVLGQVSPARGSSRFSPDEVAELEKRLDEPGERVTTTELLERLKSRDEE